MTLLSLSIAALAGSFFGLLLGGFSKGALGLGLPLIAVPILSMFMPIPQALAILTVPVFLTNIWQAMQGGNLGAVIKRFWPMTIALVIGIGLGTQLLVRLDQKTLYLIMGTVVLIQPAVRLLKPNFVLSLSAPRWVGPGMAAGGGLLGGVSGFYGPPLMVYLAMLKLPKDLFTATIAMLFFVGGLSLAIFLAQLDVMNQSNLILSTAALIPAVLGIFIGQKIRARISQKQFERAITVAMLLIGLSLLSKGFA
jgi:uncharacterized membrane protein YfcA